MPNKENLLTIRKASEYLNFDKKALENYVKKGHEIPRQLVGRINKINRDDLDIWKRYFDETTVILDQASYYRALKFSLRKFYSGAPRANFATSTQREAGKYLSDHITGYLGELAFQKFMDNEFNLQLRLDNNVDGLVRSQDIVAVSRRRGVENQPAFKISVKSSKMKNVWLIVGKNEIELSDRKSDYYIFVRVNLLPDHIVRLIRSHPSVEEIQQIIPHEETSVKTQVCGFTETGSLAGPTSQIDTQNISPSYVKRSGELRRDWTFIAENL